ncbi:MAG: type I 3-dehydroquinate dehydratase, partial [Chthoniobacteraceae bacterium]
MQRTSTATACLTGGRKRASISGLDRAHVVAAVHTEGGLRIAAKLRPGEVDCVELRVDALADRLDLVRRTASGLRVPILLTVRHPAEGGVGGLSARRRRELLMEFLPIATLVDVELCSSESMRGVSAS